MTILSIILSLVSLVLFSAAYTLARLASQSRLLNACDMTIDVMDGVSDIKKTFHFLSESATTTPPITRSNWVAKYTMEAVAKMLIERPAADVQRMTVEITASKIYDAK
jgi:hypothetical protein